MTNVVMDFGDYFLDYNTKINMYFQGNNGTFDMIIENDEGVFEVTPHQGINEASFLIRVKDSSRIDFEKASGKRFVKF